MMRGARGRNVEMAERIERAPARSPLSFVVAGDTGAWPDPTADAIFGALVEQTAALDPPPAFFANLGDFAGPGTPERHEHYLRLVERLDVPPYLDGHFAPHAEWGFTYREADFLDILRRHGVALVCCAHGLAFDH